jgi:hypothetical protein
MEAVSGTATAGDKAVTGGSFEIDMNTIRNEDIEKDNFIADEMIVRLDIHFDRD